MTIRDNLRIGMVDNQKLVKKLKLKYGAQWFENIVMSGLVLRRYDGETLKYDFTSENTINFGFWINKHSLKDVDELSGEAYKIYELLR